MSDVNNVLSYRREHLASEIGELSKRKFFAIRSLSYCLGFIGSSINSLNESIPELGSILSSDEQYLPAEWILEKGSNLIASDFGDYDLIDSHPVATRMVNYLKSQLFIALMAELEDYLNKLLRLILSAYPEKLQSEHFDVRNALAQENAQEVLEEKINDKIRKKQYDRSKQFFNFVKLVLDADKTIDKLLDERGIKDTSKRRVESEKLSLERLLSPYIEMKARRDLGIHNGWIRNSLYDERVADLGDLGSQENFLGISNDYFKQASDLAIDIVAKCNMFCKISFVNAD